MIATSLPDPSPVAKARRQTPTTDELVASLERLHTDYLARHPENGYLVEHSQPSFIVEHVRIVKAYASFLPANGPWLDWGCNHAPDSFLLRELFEGPVELHACDFVDKMHFASYYEAAQTHYKQLDHVYRLPYEDSQFRAVIASGALEHTAMPYESLKELYRVMQVGGVLVLTYIPNFLSIHERWYRWRGRPGHKRLFRRREIGRMLMSTGFLPEVIQAQNSFQIFQDRVHACHMTLRHPVFTTMRVFGPCILAIARKTRVM